MEVLAHSISEAIDIDSFQVDYGTPPIARTSRELFYSLGKNAWFSITSYGALAFCNSDKKTESEIVELAKRHAGELHQVMLSEDHTINKGKISFATSRLTVPQITPEIIRVVLQNVAQSVTLDHYRRVAANLLGEVKGHAEELEARGKIRLKEKLLNRFIGRVLKIKNRIAEHFYIFADLDVIWEDDHLTKIHRGVAQTLDLKARYEEVENSFKIIEENLHMFNEFHMHGQSYRIEIIITLLIVIEVLDLIGDKFKLFH